MKALRRRYGRASTGESAIRYYLFEQPKDGSPRWKSEIHVAEDSRFGDPLRIVKQSVVAGFTGTARWAEDETGRFLCGMRAGGPFTATWMAGASDASDVPPEPIPGKKGWVTVGDKKIRRRAGGSR